MCTKSSMLIELPKRTAPYVLMADPILHQDLKL
jgi:hypothetical protein